MWDKFWPPWILSTSKFPSVLLHSPMLQRALGFMEEREEREKQLSWYWGRDGEVSSQAQIIMSVWKWHESECGSTLHVPFMQSRGPVFMKQENEPLCVLFLFGNLLISSHSYELLRITSKVSDRRRKKVETTLVIGNNQTIFLFLMFRDWFLNSFYWVSFCNPIEHSKEYLLLKG